MPVSKSFKNDYDKWLVNRTEIKFLYLDRNIHITISILFKDVSYLSKYTYLCTSISSIWFSQTGTGTVQMGDGTV